MYQKNSSRGTAVLDIIEMIDQPRKKQTKKSSMQKVTTATQIFETRDYERFSLIASNRLILRQHVEALKKSMEKKYWISPIVVNSKMEILDGQHRYTAAMELGLPIRYFISGSITIEDVGEANSLVRKWQIPDYLHSFKQQGIRDYERFEQFILTYPEMPRTTAIALLSGSDNRRKVAEDNFTKSVFRIKDWAGAVKKAEFLQKVALTYKGTYRKAFIDALFFIMNNAEFSEERFFRKLELKHVILKNYSKKKDFIPVLEEMYNWMESKKVRFY